MKILGTGLNGLVGSRITNLLKNKYSFENLSRSNGVDITDKDQITNAVFSSDAPVFLHMAAKTDVDGCENDKKHRENGEAWKLNVNATKNIASICKKTNKKIMYISTDFVFDGKKDLKDAYTENDLPNPLNWYAVTKYEGEKQIIDSGTAFVILRIAYPFGHAFENKKDFVRAIMSCFENRQKVMAITDHIFVPTFIDDIAVAIDNVIAKSKDGIFHIVGSQALTPYEASLMIAKKFNFSESLIEKITRDEYFQGRALRPYNLSLRNDKIKRLGVKMKSFEEALREINK